MSVGKISEYPNAAIAISDTDLFDISVDLGGGLWESKKITGLVLKGLLQKMPAGGTVGQALVKIDGSDYNTQWVTIGAGVNVGKLLLIKPNLNAVQYASFALANAAAVAGDTIHVFNGVYNENNVIKAGVFYEFHEGAKVNYTGVDVTAVINALLGTYYVYGSGEFSSTTSPVYSVIAGQTLHLYAREIRQISNDISTSLGTLIGKVETTISDGTEGFRVAGILADIDYGRIEHNNANPATYALTIQGEGQIRFTDMVSAARGVFSIIPSGKTASIYYNSITAVEECHVINGVGRMSIYEGAFAKTTNIVREGIEITNGICDYHGKIETTGGATLIMNGANAIFNLYGTTSGGSAAIPSIVMNSGTLNIMAGSVVKASLFRAIQMLTGGTAPKVYNFGRIEHTFAGSAAVYLVLGDEIFISCAGSQIITSGANSIDALVPAFATTYPASVSNKPLSANITEKVSTMLISSDII